MNKKGFTLVELLAVIIILSLLAVLVGNSVSKVLRDSKNDLYDAQISLIESAAKTWGSDNLDRLPNAGECKYITLGDLKLYGVLESSITNPKTNEEFSDEMYIKITSSTSVYGNAVLNYEVDAQDVTGCTSVYDASLETENTVS